MTRIARLIICLLFAAFAPVVHGDQANEIVTYGSVQLASNRTIVVTDTNGMPIAATVAEMSSDWRRTLRSQKTNSEGEFELEGSPSRKIHYLQILVPNFKELRVRVRFDQKRGKKLRFKLNVGD